MRINTKIDMISFMMDGFHRHNIRLRNTIRCGWASRKVYIQYPELMPGDIKKVLMWRL